MRIWLALLAIGLGYEAWAFFTRRAPTLTRVIVDHVPWTVTFGILGWLVFHFISAYSKVK